MIDTEMRAKFEATMGAALKADQSEWALSRAHDAEQSYTFLATKWAWKAWQLAARAPAQEPVSIDALRELNWVDRSNADPIEKARRVLGRLIKPDDVYFYRDGFPRSEIGEDAENVLKVLDALAAQPASAQPETWKVLPSPARVTGEMLHQAFPEIPGEPWPLTGVRKVVWERFAERVNARLAATPLPPLNDTMREILGRPNFMCITLAKQLRLRGHTIANRSEDEQAAVIYFLLSLYLEHGEAWLDKGNEYFDRPLPAASTGEPIQEAKEGSK